MPRLPLEGIRVLDSAYVFALPYTGRQLTDWGPRSSRLRARATTPSSSYNCGS